MHRNDNEKGNKGVTIDNILGEKKRKNIFPFKREKQLTRWKK